MEGKWTPEQVLQLGAPALRELGLELPPEALWRREGGGLLEAAVRIDGCSAGFLSADGLLLTNHHCAFPILQQHSRPERDLITGGFLAGSRGEELPGDGVRATLPHLRRDVTAEVEAAAEAAGNDDLARYRAIERRRKELVAACERQPFRRCEVAAFDGGSRYLLLENLEFPDVRLVFAPPRAVGEYGGEVDNWSWPRHTGDFALLRVYADAQGNPAPASPDNVPYRPAHWFKPAPRGVEPGDFVMIAGYPATTYRSLTASEMRERSERYFPRRATLYRAWMDRMEAASARDDTARIALSDRLKGLANNEKSSRGQVDGFQRGHLLEKKQEAEQQVLAWAAKRPDQQAAVAAFHELIRLAEARLATWDRDFLLQQMKRGPKPLDLALTLVRWAHEQAKPDLEREPDYQERQRDALTQRLRNDQKRFYLPVEEELLTDLFTRFQALPEAGRIAGLPTGSPQGLRDLAARMLAATRVDELEERLKMFGESEEQLRARRDPLLDLAFTLDAALRASEEERDRGEGAVSRLRPRWLRAVEAFAGKPVAPDANSTLRVSFARVQGYAPRDGIWMQPQTTVAGMVEKHTGEEPFAAPEKLRTAAAEAPRSPWAAPKLRDVPVAFLADADTTGGNSGSPLLNARGELVGVNFDRVWENVANDFGYNPAVARNITVDLRYLYWVLATLHGEAARPLLQELGTSPPPPAAGP